VAVQESESLNDSFGFERDLWQRKTGQSSHVPKTSVFGRVRNGGCADFIAIQFRRANVRYSQSAPNF
jgi:hypothetical protein